jgi:hypothetical protein
MIDDELERIWKETILAQSKYYLHIYLLGTEEKLQRP